MLWRMLLFYHARYYDPGIGRFISADTIVPGSNALTVAPLDAVANGAWGTRGNGPANPQELNRYSYGRAVGLRDDPAGRHGRRRDQARDKGRKHMC